MPYEWSDSQGAPAARPGSIVVTSFPSAGLATTVAGHFMIRSLKLARTGLFEAPEMAPVAVIQGGEVQPPIRAYGNGALSLVLSEFPPSPGQATSIARAILEGARHRKAGMIVCLEGVVPHPNAAEGEEAPPDENAEASWVALSHRTADLDRRFLKPPSKLLSDGVIGGVTGALLVLALSGEIPVVALLVSARATEGYPDDRAGAHLIETFTGAFPEFQIDTGPLRAQAEEIEKMLRASIQRTAAPPAENGGSPATDMYR
ncbi:MAG: proteasome assembly chaperone family protein [Thermoplasmata archaeon]